MRFTSFSGCGAVAPNHWYRSTWFRRLAAVTNHFMSGEKRRWYGSTMFVTVRSTAPVVGSRKVSVLPVALATISVFSSGARYR